MLLRSSRNESQCCSCFSVVLQAISVTTVWLITSCFALTTLQHFLDWPIKSLEHGFACNAAASLQSELYQLKVATLSLIAMKLIDLQLLLDAIETPSLFFLTALPPVKIIKRTSNLELLLLGSTGRRMWYYVKRCGFWKKKDILVTEGMQQLFFFSTLVVDFL